MYMKVNSVVEAYWHSSLAIPGTLQVWTYLESTHLVLSCLLDYVKMFCMNHAQYFISFINILKPTFCSLNTPNVEGETMYASRLFTFTLLSRVLLDLARRLTR
jgi:hypothetical protein